MATKKRTPAGAAVGKRARKPVGSSARARKRAGKKPPARTDLEKATGLKVGRFTIPNPEVAARLGVRDVAEAARRARKFIARPSAETRKKLAQKRKATGRTQKKPSQRLRRAVRSGARKGARRR